MLKSVEKEAFLELISGDADLHVVDIFSKVSNVNPLYLVYFKDKPIIALAVYVKNNRIVLPKFSQLVYSEIWVNKTLSERRIKDSFLDCLYLLKKRYKSIELVLPPSLSSDIRFFLWNGFFAKIRYTYIKDSNDMVYSYSIEKHYKRALSVFNLKLERFFEFDLICNRQFTFLLKKGLIKDKKRLYKCLKEMFDLGKLWCFGIKDNEENLIGTGMLLVNINDRKAYFLFCDTEDGNSKSAANAFLYIEIQKYLLSMGIDVLDYMGGNIKSISAFKQGLNAKLSVYYILRYDIFEVVMHRIFLFILRTKRFFYL